LCCGVNYNVLALTARQVAGFNEHGSEHFKIRYISRSAKRLLASQDKTPFHEVSCEYCSEIRSTR
jgi:putative heme iron utilization protein